MKRIILLTAMILLLQSILPFPVRAEEGVSTLLIEAHTGTVLSESDADAVRPVGSLAKLMTAYLTAKSIGNGDLAIDTVLTAGEEVTGTKGAVIWLEAGDTITVEELLTGLLAGNANDAASVLAKRISGSIPAFVMDMNAAAFDLGMRQTRFTSPQGYDDPESHSTASDMGILARALLEYDFLRPALSTWRTFLRDENVEIVNENTLTRTFDGCLGMKAAHSEDAGQCVIAAAQQGEMVCIAVVLGCADEDERFRTAKSLLQKGFGNYKLTTPALSEEFLMPLDVRKGTGTAVLLTAAEIPMLTVPVNAAELSSVLVLPEYLEAPVRSGQEVGMVYFYNGDTLLCGVPLLTKESMEKITYEFALQKLFRMLFT